MVPSEMADKLTQCCDRMGFHQRLESLMQDESLQGYRVAILLIDLNRFSEVNETIGLGAGDEVLKVSAQRISGVLRESDLLARVGDDEFAVLIPKLKNPAMAQLAAARVSEALKAPILLDPQVVSVNTSIGVAYYPDHGDDVESLCQSAHVALLESRRERAEFSVYVPIETSDAASNLHLEHDLRSAIDNNELELYYQPKVDCRSGEVISVEALLRWNSAKYGMVSPEKFIPLAESTGMIRTLTYWVLKAAAGQCARWLKQGLDISVAVNLSPDALLEAELPQLVRQVLQLWDIEPGKLVLEITEGSLMSDPQASLVMLEQLTALGVKTSIDDFGTGYSSLAYLKQLPVDELKIDKSFVQNLPTNEGDRKIVRSIIDLAGNFELRVVAEGIEDRETWAQLEEMGCDVLQGYFISRPRPAAEVAALIRERPWLAKRVATEASSPAAKKS